MRFGVRLASGMSDAQLDEFESYINKNDESGGSRSGWKLNFPNYKDVVAEELGKLKEEVKASAPQILEEVFNGQNRQPPANPPQPQ